MDEGDTVSLRCELSKPAVPLEWKKGELGLCPCAKYDIQQAGTLATLVIHDVDPEDSGSYTCDSGACRSTAQLVVKGTLLKTCLFFHGFLLQKQNVSIVVIHNLPVPHNVSSI